MKPGHLTLTSGKFNRHAQLEQIMIMNTQIFDGFLSELIIMFITDYDTEIKTWSYVHLPM